MDVISFIQAVSLSTLIQASPHFFVLMDNSTCKLYRNCRRFL